VLSAFFSKQDKTTLSEEFDHLIPPAQREEGEYLARKTYDLWISKGLIIESPEIKEALKVARSRDMGAQLKLARAYELGSKVPRNLTRALSWYLVAAKNGSKEAEVAIPALRKRMTLVQIRDAEMASDELSR
jgi:TPR repeat protein